MKFCEDCQSYKDGFCSIKGYNVSINANFCEDYKLSSDIRRKEVAEWLIAKGIGFGLLMDPADFSFHKNKDIIDLMLDWGDKCLNESKK